MSSKNVEAIYALAPSQQGMLFETLSGPASGIHIEQSTYLLRGRLDVAAFEQAWQRVVARHAILRTAFVWKDQAEPLQVVLRHVDVPVERQDWRGMLEHERRERLQTFLEHDRQRGFKLARAPLMRLALLQIADDAFYFVWLHHHILMDGWCRPVIVREVLTLYQALCGGHDAQLGHSRPYRDYIAWLKQRDQAQAERFWRAKLAGFAEPTPLGRAAARPGHADPIEPYGQVAGRLPAEATAALRAIAGRRHLTLNTVLQGVWALLLSRYGDRDDVVFGATVSGRPSDLPGIESTIGLFINTLPVRVRVDPAAELWPWLAGIQAANLELRQYEYVPAGQVHEWSDAPPTRPLYESILVVESYAVDTAMLGAAGLSIDPVQDGSNVARTKYALAILAATGAELAIQLVFDRRRLDPDGAARALDHMLLLLGCVAAEPEQTLGGLLERVAPEQAPAVYADSAARARTSAFVPPRTALEQALAGIWARTLGVAQVGALDNFFELGGHSLVATQLVARLREAFQVQLPLRALFEAPTVTAMAALIAEQTGAQAGEPGAADEPAAIEPDVAGQHEPFALTDVQHAYWVGRSPAFTLGNVAAHVYFEIDVTGLDLARFTQAWQQLIARHPMLRAVVRPDGLQQVLPSVPPYLVEQLDLRQATPEAAEARLAELRAARSHAQHPPEHWPLFQVAASLLPSRRTRLHISIDLLIADAWSLQIIRRELGQLYREPGVQLPGLGLTFRDYVLASPASPAASAAAWAYWQPRLDSLPSAPQLPLAADPASLRQPRFARHSASLPPTTWRTLTQRAAAAGLTPSGLLLAVFAEALARWAASPQFTLTLTLFNRAARHPHVAALVGDFTALTLLAVDAPPEAGFLARAQRLQAQLWADLDHQAVSGVELLRALARQRGAPVTFPVVFTSTLGQDAGDQGVFDFDETTETTAAFAVTQTPQVWLDQQVAESQGTLQIAIDAVTALLPPDLVHAILHAQLRLLHHLADPHADWAARLPDLRPADHSAITAALNATAGPLPSGLLHDPLLAQARLRPHAPAVITPTLTLTFADLLARASALAHRLRAHQAAPGQLVAVCLPKGAPQIVATLAVLLAGAAYVPLDPTLPPARIRQLLAQTRARLALADPDWAAAFAWPDAVTPLPVPDTTPEPPPPPLEPVARPTDLAYVIFTSGSTGTPKGVMICHQAALNTLDDLTSRYAIGPHDRVLGLSALSFDLSVYDIFGVLGAGGALLLPDPAASRDPAAWHALATSQGVTLWNSVPALLTMYLTYLHGQALALPPSLRQVWLSGDWIGLTLPAQLWALGPDVRLLSLGGATEAAIWSIGYDVTAVEASWRSVPYGRPLRNQQLWVLDAGLHERPLGVVGELYIGGDGLAAGYWGDAELSAARFVRHPATGARLYRTGDLGRYGADGTIEFMGRADAQVKVQGYRIELGEVEAALAGHAGVRAAVVAALGERLGAKRLVAYVVPHDGYRPRTADPSAELRAGHPPAATEVQAPTADAGQLLGPLARLEFKLRQPGLRRDSGRPSVGLARPEPSAALRQAYTARRSQRVFSDRPVPIEQLGALLAALMPIALPGAPLPKYRYPSAGSLYPVQAYLHVKPGRVAGLAGGVYYYHPGEHSLVLLGEQAAIDRDIHHPVNQPIFDQSAFAIVLIGQLRAIEPIYGQLARDFCMLEAGAITQLLMTAAPASQIGLCPIGDFDFERARHAFALDDGHVLLHSLLGGLADDEQPPDAPSPEPPNAARLADELREFLRERLPEYMLPSAFVLLDALPLSANGKVDRSALPQPGGPAAEPATSYVMPQTEAERAIAAILQEILGIERVGIHDNFFDLGGHSLHMVQAYNRLRELFNHDFPVVALFEHPTVSLLAGFLSSAAPERPAQQQGADRGALRRAAGQRRKGAGHE